MFQSKNVIPYKKVTRHQSKKGTYPSSHRMSRHVKSVQGLPDRTYFQKDEHLYSSTRESCSVITTNVFLNFEWLPINCSRRIEYAAYICEQKLSYDPGIGRSPISSGGRCCRVHETILGIYCLHLSEFVYKQTMIKSTKTIKDLLLQSTNYFTAWTRRHISVTIPGDSTVEISIMQHQICLYTKSLFFAEVKEWFIKSCALNQTKFLNIRLSDKNDKLCGPSQSKCLDGTCILSAYWCDGTADCPDKSDEKNCSDFYHPNDNNKDRKYRCQESKKFISIARFCNGVADCEDASDEYAMCLSNLQMDQTQDFHYFPCPISSSLCNSNDTICFPNHQICIHTKTLIGESAFCPTTEHLKYCRNHQCPQDFKVKYIVSGK